MSNRTFGPGDTYSFYFTTRNAAGELAAPDALPTAQLWRNGAAEATPVVTVTNLATGEYYGTAALPGGWALGGSVATRVALVMDGTPDADYVDSFLLETRAAAVNTAVAAVDTVVDGIATAVTTLGTAVAAVDTGLDSLATAAALATADGVIDDVLADLLVLKAALVGTAAKNATTGTVTATTDDARTVTVAQSETVRTLTVS